MFLLILCVFLFLAVFLAQKTKKEKMQDEVEDFFEIVKKEVEGKK